MAFLLAAVVVVGASGTVLAHTVDSVGPYRLEIGWMNEPVVSGHTNAIEIYVSPMEPGLDLEEQAFSNGVTGLEDTLRLDLVRKDKSITLSLVPDHNIPGKYYAFVYPTVSAFYQTNLSGMIKDTPISLSMHPPKVEERAYIEFPHPANNSLNYVTEKYDALTGQISDLDRVVEELAEANRQTNILSTVAILVGISGIAIAAAAFVKSKNNQSRQ